MITSEVRNYVHFFPVTLNKTLHNRNWKIGLLHLPSCMTDTEPKILWELLHELFIKGTFP